MASVSGGMAGRYEGAPGARLLEYGSGVMLGMSVMSMLVLLRERMRRDAAA